jgi:DTW domain-containing protein YfiP
VQGLKVVRNESDLSEQDDGEERGQDMKFRDMEMTLVVVDGTWEHAQEMVKASLPFLSNFVTQVCLPFDVRSEGYGVGESDLITRKEPFGGCVSTMEAVARALAILEPDGHIVASKLIDVLRKMVALQASHCSSPKVRPKLKKKSKECSQLPLDWSCQFGIPLFSFWILDRVVYKNYTELLQ